MQTKRFIPVLFLFMLSTLFVSVVRADPYPGPEPMPPAWRPDGFEGLRIAYQRVEVTIDNQIATTHIEQLFVNEADWMLEGTYLYPLPEGATVSELTMWVDGEPIESKILPKDEARAIYDEIVRQMRDPALLEYVDRNVIQASVFPIPPGEERRIEIEYSSLLPADNGLIHYTFPQATNLYSNAPLEEQAIRVEIASAEPIRAIYSPTHPVDLFQEDEFHAVAGYEAQNVTPDQDYDLIYTVSPEDVGVNLMSYREPGSDGFFMLLAAPNVVVNERIAKDVILVMDTSGSMQGEKMQQAKDAARYVVGQLNSEDRFNIVTFGTGTRRFAEQLRLKEAPGDVESFISSMESIGGTNISTALLDAAAMVDPSRPTTLIFVTDGNATEGITQPGDLISAVADVLPANARLFAFGVGNDVDPDLLDSLAQQYRGTTTYVRENESIDAEIQAFFEKVSTPVLSDIALEIEGAVVDQMYPTALPDLFAGSQLVLTGRYRGGGPVTVHLTGNINGRSQTFIYTGQELHDSGGDAFIPRIWATRAVGHMLRDIRLNGEQPELVQSVMNLSTRYGIITPYTSFLIEEDDIFEQLGREPRPESTIVNADGTTQESIDWVVGENRVVEETVEEAIDSAEAVAAMADAEGGVGNMGAMPAFPDAFAAQAELAVIGAKSFVLRDGIWIDTAYDADIHTLQSVLFASDAYFDLITAEADLGSYFSLSSEMVLVVGDVAYLVSESVESVDDLVLPETGQEPDGVSAEGERPADSTKPRTRPGLCGALLAYPILLGFGSVVMLFGRKKRDGS